MDPVSSVDSLVVLLRQRLAERSRAGASQTRGKVSGSTGQTAKGVRSLDALAAIDGVDERQLKRALIQNLLTDQFGAHLINDAKFQQIIDRVMDAIDGEASSAGLLSRVAGELRATARQG
jgi:hypothetical protein